MLVFKWWTTTKRTQFKKITSLWEGWFLFGIIPLVVRFVGTEENRGLTEVIRGDNNFQSTVRIWKKNKLAVIAAGSRLPNVAEIAGSKRIGSILNSLKEVYEVVIVDAPPLVISDAYTLASKVDGVILILIPGQTREEQAKVMKEQLERAGAKVIGVVFNKISLATANSEGDHQYLSLYSPNYYSDYVSGSKREPEPETGQSKKLLAFFEHGELLLESSSVS